MQDHCTLWPDRLGGFDWAACCAAHDVDYAEQVDRLLADDRLWSCVTQSLPAVAADNPLLTAACAAATAAIAGVMWVAVRIFGKRFYDRSAR